jgi:hypothetical protein
MSHEFDGLDATEKAGIEAALNRCRGLAAQIALSLADFHACLEYAANVLGQKSRQSVDNTPAPVVKGQRHR